MYAGECAVSITQNTAKSCIQALLKAREQHQLQRLPRKFTQRNLGHFSGGFAIESKVLNLPLANKIDDDISKEAIPLEDVDSQNDFNYSQKLFHIADGNLYSIFSPIQGRSYGMKPSFLRKQKYTVQECHGRGRKNLRKGLKFHNFLPSESTTSEKNNNGAAQTKWKVHSECRLREEHGTKQITISNWSQNIHNLAEEPIQQNSFSNCDLKATPISSTDHEVFNYHQNVANSQNACDNDPYNFQMQTSDFQNGKFYYNAGESLDNEQKKQISNKTSTLKKGSLKFVLSSLLEKPLIAENPVCELPVAHSKSSSNQKHRRKPMQTKRVVPYTKYLSIIEEDDASPLDLSSKYSEVKCHSPMSFEEDFIISSKKTATNCDNIDAFIDNMSMSDIKQAAPSNTKLYPAFNNNNNFKSSSSLAHLLQNQIPSPLVLLTSPVLNTLNGRPTLSAANSETYNTSETIDGKHKTHFNMNQIKPKNIHPSQQANSGPSYSNNVQYAVHKSFIKNSQPKSRRRSQRSVIKKNLEDTFKQNGFLVKTKQVSDGEATFCKFRQLRKYTRYYLKSWQQHLPEEVNKMWKGFLPPKTVLPPVSAAPETTIGNK